uniref:Uncharacterized protein n=1 Tax=Anguilla anguilla TaxID=7936 RepID=A0A0E9U7D4_ANGAN
MYYLFFAQYETIMLCDPILYLGLLTRGKIHRLHKQSIHLDQGTVIFIYLCVMSADWPRTAEGTVRITLFVGMDNYSISLHYTKTEHEM